jgi:hypothetical protein
MREHAVSPDYAVRTLTHGGSAALGEAPEESNEQAEA